MPTRQQIIDAAPRFLNPQRNWSGKCEAAAWNLTNVLTPGAVRSFSDATSARKASRIEGPGLGPGGNWVWMSGVWGTENGRRVDWGHVAYHVGGGLLFMASSSVTDRIPGMTALGFIDGQAYLRRFSGQKLEGWSYDHGGSIIPGDGPIVVAPPHPSSAAGGAATPQTAPQEDDMPTAQEVAQEIFKGLLSDEEGSLGKQVRDKLGAAAADFTLFALLPNSGHPEGKQTRDALGKTSADYVVFELATAAEGTPGAEALDRIADAVRAKNAE